MQEETLAAVKIAPAGLGSLWAALTLNEWVAAATLLYVVLQIGLLIPKYWAWLRGRSDAK